MNYQNIEKSQEEIQEQGYLQNFFECPKDYQEVIFMMVKGDQDGLSESQLYLENQDIFNYYLQCIIEFSQQFDPTETLMIIANDPERRMIIHSAPNALVPLSYITQDLWPKLGFLPIDPENPGVALIAEFMLNELILKNSDSLDQLNLQQLKELFSGEVGDDEDLEGLDDEAEMDDEGMMMDDAQKAAAKDQAVDEKNEDEEKTASPVGEKEVTEKKADKDSSDNYSSAGSDNRFMDIADLKKRQAEQASDKKKEEDDDEYEDDFN